MGKISKRGKIILIIIAGLIFGLATLFGIGYFWLGHDYQISLKWPFITIKPLGPGPSAPMLIDVENDPRYKSVKIPESQRPEIPENYPHWDKFSWDLKQRLDSMVFKEAILASETGNWNEPIEEKMSAKTILINVYIVTKTENGSWQSSYPEIKIPPIGMRGKPDSNGLWAITAKIPIKHIFEIASYDDIISIKCNY